MERTNAPLGIVAAPPEQGPALLGVPAAGPDIVLTRLETVPLPPASNITPATQPAASPAYPRSAQWATVVLLALALILLAWHAYAAHRLSTRPTVLEPDAFSFALVDLNQADEVQLRQIHGIGQALATRIIEYREQHNGFRSVDELRRVKGIGPVMLEKIRPFVHVETYDDDDDEDGSEAPDPGRRPAPRARPAPNPGGATPRLAGSGGRKAPLVGVININRASAAELQRLPRIGPTLSRRIIETRAKRPFRSVDELRRVKGIGVKTLERLRPHVTVGSTPKAADRTE
jgi:competence protein ComEA